MRSFLLSVGILSVCAVSVIAAPIQESNDPNPQSNEPPAHAKDFDWNKTFDASLMTEPERKKWARQYTALTPLVRQMRELFERERIDAMSLVKLQSRQLEIRCRLETDIHQKKKCLEILVSQLNTLQEQCKMFHEAPARPGSAPQFGTNTIDELVDATLKTIEWQSELEQINLHLDAKVAK